MNAEEKAWTLAIAVIGSIGAFAYFSRVKTGDVVEVPVSAIRGLPPGAPIDPNVHLALRVKDVVGDVATGSIAGIVQGDQIMNTAFGPESALLLSFAKSDIVKKIAN